MFFMLYTDQSILSMKIWLFWCGKNEMRQSTRRLFTFFTRTNTYYLPQNAPEFGFPSHPRQRWPSPPQMPHPSLTRRDPARRSQPNRAIINLADFLENEESNWETLTLFRPSGYLLVPSQARNCNDTSPFDQYVLGSLTENLQRFCYRNQFNLNNVLNIY